MKWTTLVLCELAQRKNRLVTSGLAIVLGIAVVVAISTITTYSEKAVARELDALGANILILPESATLSDYYSADLTSGEMPEEYVTLLATSNLEGLDNVSPKLSISTTINSYSTTLTGVLPKNEFQSKASWQGAGVFSRPRGCGNVQDLFNLSKRTPKETLVRKRVIETLKFDELLVGSDVAKQLTLQEGDEIALLNTPFKVIAVLPPTGTVDDSRIFAHLHRVQELAGSGPVINAIEIVGCCEEISKGLVSKIGLALPHTKIVTIAQVVDTQIKTNQLMKRLSMLFLIIMMVVGGTSMANEMYNNVHERRKEIGTLMALGADARQVLWVFLLKALILGGVGGTLGYVLGTLMALILGPIVAGVAVWPVPALFLVAVAVAIVIALLASYLPARQATRLDPCKALQEI